MTRARLARLGAVEAARWEKVGPDLSHLTDAELDALHIFLLRREGHPDPEGEAARVRGHIEAMSTEDLRAFLARLEGGTT